MRAVRLIVASGLLGLLSACGSGGDKGDDDSGAAKATSISATPNPVNVVAGALGTTVKNLDVVFEGNGLVAGYPPGVTPPSWLTITQSDAFAGKAQVHLTINGATFQAGLGESYSTTIRLSTGRSATNDFSTATNISFVDIPVSVSVTPAITTTPAALTITSKFGSTPASATNTLTVDRVSGGNWTVTSNDSWLTATPTSGTTTGTLVTVQASTTGKSQGNTPGSLTFRETLTGATTTLPVTLAMVAPDLLLSATDAAVALSNMNTPTASVTVSDDATTAGTVPTTGSPAGAASWTVSVDQPWLIPSATSGKTNPSSVVTFSLDKPRVLAFSAGVYNAAATFKYTRIDGTIGQRIFSVTLTKSANPTLKAISSNLGVVGQTFETVFLGTGLTGLAGVPGTAAIKFGTVTATVAPVVVNDSEVRVTYPTLAAGTYDVTITPPNGLFPVIGPVKFTVLAQQIYAAVTLPALTTSERSRAIFDPRGTPTLYVQGNALGTLDIFKFSSGAWQKSVTTPALATPISDIALTLPLDTSTTSGSPAVTTVAQGVPKLLAVNSSAYYELDTATNALTQKAAQTTSVTRLASLLDGTVFARGSTTNASYLYDPLTATQSTLTTTGVAITTPFVGASPDGRLVLIGNSLAAAVFYPSTRAVAAVTPAIAQTATSPTLSRSGDRFILDANRGVYFRPAATNVTAGAYTANTVVPSIPTTADAGNTISPNMQLSPDGAFAYVVEMSAAGQPVRVRKYAVSTTAIATVPTSGTTSFTLPLLMNGSVTTKPPIMTISPDGKTLFVVGGALGAVVAVN